MVNAHGLPAKLKIGALTYKLGYIPDEVQASYEEENKIIYGRHNNEKQIIQIKKESAGKDQVIDTLLHEVLHALWDHFNLPTQNEEKCVQAIGAGMTMFFKDNPEVTSYIKRYLK